MPNPPVPTKLSQSVDAPANASQEETTPTVVVTPAGTIKSGRLKGLTMWHAIFVLSWPVLIESFLNAMVGMVDTTLAAGMSEAATDAVGAASYFLWFIGLVGMAVGVGLTALVSRSMGKGRTAVANAALGQATIISMVLGCAVAVVIYAIAPTIADWLNLSEEAHEKAVMYLRIVTVGVPAQTFLMSAISGCRGAGDSFKPLLTMAAVNLVNVLCSFLLCGTDLGMTSIVDGKPVVRTLVENPGWFDLGLNGIAAGTVIAWYTGAAIMGLILVRGTHGLKLMGKRLRPHAHTMRRLLKLGIPNYIETFGMWFGNFLVISIVGWMATDGLLGSHIVAIRIEAFSFLPGFAMAMAASTLAGQYIGAGSEPLAKKAVLRCTFIAASIMFLFGLAFLLIPDRVVGLFTQQPTHMAITPRLLFICGFIQIPFAIGMCIRGALRGAGDTTVVMILTWVGTYLVRLPLAWLGSGVDIPLPGGGSIPNPAPLHHFFPELGPLEGLWIGICIEHCTRAMLYAGRFFFGNWAAKSV